MSTIGNRIKGFREARKMTQEDLAAALGLKKQTISNYENDRREPTFETLGNIAKILNVPLARILEPPRKVELFDGPGSIRFSPSAPLFPTDEPPLPPDAIPASSMQMVPVIGLVKGGTGGAVCEERLGVEPAYITGNADEYFYLKVIGNSMAPQINEGDLALVKRQNQADNGQVVVAIVRGEFNDEGVIKQFKTYPSAVSLISFNPNHEPRFFPGKEMNRVRIVGKVVQTVRKWD